MSARDVAFDVLEAVRLRDAYANLELPHALRRAHLSPADAGFATELTYGTLRMRGLYDAIIQHAARRQVSDIDGAALDILRIGTHQWIALGTPAHAVVDESARAARRHLSRGAIGFVNAVMRRVTERTVAQWLDAVLDGLNTDDAVALRFSHPAWIVRALRNALAHEARADELEQLLGADNLAAQVTLVRLRGDHTIPGTHRGLYSPRAEILERGDPSALDAVRTGAVRVQDEGSQLAALVMTRQRAIAPGELWLDMCAGPGGKTALLAAESVGNGVHLLANEFTPHRADLVRSAVKGFDHVDVRVGDGREFGQTHPDSFDRILVDAPCSGLGALRRRPESRWRRTTKDVATLTGIQWDLLVSAIAALKPGGILVYVTCSPHLVETRSIIDRAVRDLPGVHECDARAVLNSMSRETVELAGTDLSVQLWPHRHGTDAMFIAVLTKDELAPPA